MIKHIIISITAIILFHCPIVIGATVPDIAPNEEWHLDIIYRVLGTDNSYQRYVARLNHKGEFNHMPEEISWRHVIPPEYEKPIQLNKERVMKLYSLIAKAINSIELKPPQNPERPHFIQWKFSVKFKDILVRVEDSSNETPITEVNEALRAIEQLRLSFQRKDDDSDKK